MEKRGRREVSQFMLRLAVELHLRLKEEAAVSGRSLNAEMEYRLAKSFGIEYAEMNTRPNSSFEDMAADIKAIRELAEQFARAQI